MLGVDKVSSKYQTIESFTKFLAVNNLSKCKLVAMFKVRYQEGEGY